MGSIAVVCRDLPYMKLLHPICEYFNLLGVPYILYHWDAPRGDKEYNRASLNNLNKSSPEVVKGATKVRSFSNDEQMLAQMKKDKINKIVSVEIWLWLKHLKQRWLVDNNIRMYNILYLTDSLWNSPFSGLWDWNNQKFPISTRKHLKEMWKVYYNSEYLMKTHHDFNNIEYFGERDRCLGSPIFDPIINKPSDGKDILVLLPNLRKEHVAQAFGSSKNFIKIIEKISHGGDLIFKTRKKQWLPNEIKQYAKEIIDDGEIMYPTVISDLLQRCYCTVMFFSSGIYECVYGGNRVYNIPFSLKRWSWDKKKLQQYFSTSAPSVYSFPGVVESIEQKTILGDWEFKPVAVDEIERQKWMSKYIGLKAVNCAKEIVKDILEK